jgi:hypothetical protein
MFEVVSYIYPISINFISNFNYIKQFLLELYIIFNLSSLVTA